MSLSALPGQPWEDDAPVFAEPWEAQAFGLAVHLHARGAFSWEDWAAALSREIADGPERSYYGHWLAALERIVTEAGLTSAAALDARRVAWHEAAARTPHGQPILLDPKG